MTNNLAAYFFTGISIAAISSPISARIGDSKSNLESRLLKANGIVLREDSLLENRQTGMPYLEYEEYYPKPYDVRLYFKPADGRRPKPLDGWELHVLYVKGNSVLEVYKKTSDITEFEIKHLLVLQAGKSFWQESTPEDLPDGKFSALGFDLARDDGQLRAKKLGSRAIMIFRTQTDEFFHTAQQKDQTQLAPESIEGF